MMDKSLIPEGWSVDMGDPSVGIFGEEFCHDECTEDYEKGCVHTLTSSPTQVPGHVLDTHLIHCEDCGSWTVFNEVINEGVDA